MAKKQNLMEYWEKLRQPPPHALKEIRGGRLAGKTDINPQWRYQALTEVFGPCGIGWRYEILRVWQEPGEGGEIFAFAEVKLYVTFEIAKEDGTELIWSHPIPGIGGSKLIQSEKSGMYNNDEAYKMAVTDALSVAFKMLGGAADIYAGLWDGSKYKDVNDIRPMRTTPKRTEEEVDEESPFDGDAVHVYPHVRLPTNKLAFKNGEAILGTAQGMGWTEEEFLSWFGKIVIGKQFHQINQAQSTYLLKTIKDQKEKLV